MKCIYKSFAVKKDFILYFLRGHTAHTQRVCRKFTNGYNLVLKKKSKKNLRKNITNRELQRRKRKQRVEESTNVSYE